MHRRYSWRSNRNELANLERSNSRAIFTELAPVTRGPKSTDDGYSNGTDKKIGRLVRTPY